MNIKVNNKIDEKIATAIFIQFVVLILQYLILFYFKIESNYIGSLVKLISKMIVGLFFLMSFKTVLLREYKLILFVYCISIVIFLINLLLFPINSESIRTIVFDYFFMCLPCFVYSFSIDSYDAIYVVIEKVSYIVLSIGVIILILTFFNIINVGTYDMSLSYYLLIPTLINVNKFLNKISFKYLLLSVLSFMSILIIGARGPILCIGIYVIIFLVNSLLNKNSFKKMIFYIGIILFIILFLLFLKNILYTLNEILLLFGINSRTISVFLAGKINNMSNRDVLFSKAINLIKQYPVLGVGIAGDRYYLQGTYVHNLFLELILNFGLFFGSLISIFLIFIFLKTSFLINKKASSFLSIFACLGFIPLMISGSYLTGTWFWIYLGISLKYIFNNRKGFNMMQ